VIATTRAPKIGYVGHSQGCTLALMLLAARPEYNEKLSMVAHLGVRFLYCVRCVVLVCVCGVGMG
jgi:pimeloyl-ACP methyl ester carboxylesterase